MTMRSLVFRRVPLGLVPEGVECFFECGRKYAAARHLRHSASIILESEGFEV